MPRYALKETLASRQQGRDLWFKSMTAIGPCAATNIDERATFASLESAKMCPAMFHGLSFYEPVEIGDSE